MFPNILPLSHFLKDILEICLLLNKFHVEWRFCAGNLVTKLRKIWFYEMWISLPSSKKWRHWILSWTRSVRFISSQTTFIAYIPVISTRLGLSELSLLVSPYAYKICPSHTSRLWISSCNILIFLVASRTLFTNISFHTFFLDTFIIFGSLSFHILKEQETEKEVLHTAVSRFR